MKKRHLPLTHELCERAILDAYRKKWKRRDYAATIEKYGGVDRVRIKKEAESGIWNLRLEAVHSVALEMEQRVEDLLSGDAPDLDLDPVKTFYRIDGISMKQRELSSCCPLHQCFSHLAVLALAPLFRSRLYPWQYASLPKKGQVKLKQQVEKWLRRKSLGIRHAIKLDVKSAYKSTKHEMVMKLLRKDIPANAWVMPVVLCLMQMSGDGGLLIGGYLEAWLFNLVASYMLARALSYRKVRRGESRTLVVRAVNYADDFALLGRRWADIQSAANKLTKWSAEELGLMIKPERSRVNFLTAAEEHARRHCAGAARGCQGLDMAGFVMHRTYTTIRAKIYVRARRQYLRAQKDIDETGRVKLWRARKLISYNGYFKRTKSRKAQERLDQKRLVKAARCTVSAAMRRSI